MPGAGTSCRLPQKTDAERAADEEFDRLLSRPRERPAEYPALYSKEWKDGFDELQAALDEPWKWGPKSKPVEAAPAPTAIGAYKPDAPVEAKPIKDGRERWRTAIVISDSGQAEIPLKIGGFAVWLPRDRVRLPRVTRTPRRALAAITETGPPTPQRRVRAKR